MNSLINLALLNSEVEFLQLSWLYEKIANSMNSSCFNWNQQTALEEIRKAQNLVYRVDGLIHSFITYRIHVDRFEISALGSDPEFRNRGCAQSLLKELKICATDQKRPIWLEVHEQNSKALQLYKHCGFTAVHRRKAYYSDLGDAVVMTWTDGS